MNRYRSRTLTIAAVVLLVAGLWLTMHRASEQSELGGGRVFGDLTPALGDVSEIRLSKGDGSRTTLRKAGNGWTVVEREYPADSTRVRELVLGLANMKIVEPKTSDPANYARLGVEATDSPTATGTLVEVVAGDRTWALIVGKGAEGRSAYVRKPADATSALVDPGVSADPDPKRWLDRQLMDINGAAVQEVSVDPASGASYLLTRDKRGTDLVLSPVPKGRKAASSMALNAQGETLIGFNFDDMRQAPATPAAATDRATFRTFDGQVLEFAGRKEADKAYVTITARRDAALAEKFAEPPAAPAQTGAPPADQTAAAPASTDTTPPAPAPAATPAKAPDQTTERLTTRGKGLEFEIPSYKYESLFRPLEDLLEPK